MLSVIALVVVVAFGPRSAFSRFNSVLFSPVQQCGSFNILFSGGKPPASLPLTWDSATATGAAVTFLPFAAETEFVASLDDTYGNPTGATSDIMRVSPSSNTSCLPDASTTPPPRYTVADPADLQECQPFNVLYDPTVVDVPPLVRAFIPKGNSTYLNRTETFTAGDTAYIMAVPGNSQVLLMFSDDTGYKQSTDLLAVGASSNMTTCRPLPDYQAGDVAPQQLSSKQGGLSRTAIIAIGVASGSVVGGIALTMAVWVYLQRRRADSDKASSLEEASHDPDTFHGGLKGKTNFLSPSWPDPGPTVIEKKSNVKTPSQPRLDDDVTQYVKNPPYADKTLGLISPTSPQYRRDVVPSPDPALDLPISSIPIPTVTPIPFATPTPPDLRPAPSSIPSVVNSPPGSISRPDSLCSDDIEQILEMATIYSPVEQSRRSVERMETVTLASTVHSTAASSRYESHVPEMPMPSSRPDARGADVPSASQWVTRPTSASEDGVAGPSSLPSPASSGQWATQRTLTPDSYAFRSPPQAPMPTTPLSEFMSPPTFPRGMSDDVSSLRLSGRPFEGRRKASRVLPLEIHSRRNTEDSVVSILPNMDKGPRR
ncbi:unnamed protein product [Somion occarium]|uniref:Uncharacterized protein n=1 Tax=Somion occarium TaxID=3059160 RepID=A0ABP1DZP7_9APHY